MGVRVGSLRKLSTKELTLLKCCARDFRESLGLQFFGSNTWTLILWPSDGKSQNIGKDPNAGKD